ncbi:DoxX family membrane protein [Patescibacteria group bacterium]|nr:MAG: DoxX family membrane protein [Patescibacteria group bacterium]
MKNVIFVLRLAMGWLFVYAGLSKITDASWTAAGYLKNAQSFKGPFAWFASPGNIGWVNFINEWGLLIIGIALLIGFYVRWASIAGIVLMTLYYFPILKFPYAGDHSYLVDEHIIYALLFWLFIAANAGRYRGLDGRRR